MTITITAFERSPDGGRGLARDTRVRWALEEVGLPYEVRLVSFRAMKEPAHLALHPFGQIPTYEEGDLALFETGSIVFHIAERHAGLLPDDADARARAIVREAKYPPIGNRGISGQGMHTGYRSYGARHASEYAPWANANIIVCVSIESLEGLENVEAIAAVEGIDMIAYGHSDLSARLGVHLQLEHPTFKAAVRRIAEACNAHGKLARGSAETEAQIEEYWRLGCKVLNLPGTDVSTYLDGLKARAGRAHARLKSIGVAVP